MSAEVDRSYDLVVVGGGPGGSSLATFVAMQGHSVLLLEKSEFPRYQIGESLLPSTINGICVLLGVDDEVAKAGFVKKLGGSFRWGKNPDPWSFYFGVMTSSRKNPAFAYQVERMKFDSILLENARKKGVDVRTGCSVTSTVVENDRISGVNFTDSKGMAGTVRARYVADASGNESTLSKAVGERVYSEFFRNFALFGYYENGKRMSSPHEGNILSAAFHDGWFWYIPISPTVTSVGAVFHASADRKIPDLAPAMDGFINGCPIIADFLSSATRITDGPYGKLRIRRDWSYSNSKFWGKGLVLIGDAACFVDPLLSQGVHLATYSALLAARSINSCLTGELDEQRAFDEFEWRYRREYGRFYEYLTFLYDMNQDEQSYFWAARSLLNTKERGNEAFVRLLAGQAAADPTLNVAQDFFDSRQGAGAVLYDIMNPPADSKKSESKYDVEGFLPKLDQESLQVQMIASFGTDRPAEVPAREGGLVTSADGMHWIDPGR